MGNKVIVTRSKLDLLADSISAKSGNSLPLTIGEMKVAVDGIALTSQTIDGGKFDIDENDYLFFNDARSGTLTISENGTYDVSQYTSVVVNIT